MFILFSLIVMRMSGAIVFNPIFGRSNVPSRAKAALALMFSLMLYAGTGGELPHEPGSMLEYGVMLVSELLFGYVLGFAMELMILIIRYSSSVIDYNMGLSMAQVFDPQTNTQVTVTSGLYYAFFVMLFLAVDGHLRLIEIFFRSAELIPFGTMSFRRELAVAVLTMFQNSILLGVQFAMPIIAMELVAEAAVGIIMRMIPGINVFVINFQVKIIVGIMMLVFLFSPMSDKLYVMIDTMLQSMWNLVQLLR